MDLFGEVFCFFALMFNLFVFIKVYSLISNKKIIFNFKSILVFLILSIIAFFANFLGSFIKSILLFLVVMFSYWYYFRESFFELFFKIVIIYVTLFLIDFMLFGLFLLFKIKSSEYLIDLNYFRGLSTLFDSLMLLFVFLLNFFRRNVVILINYIIKKFKVIYFCIALLTFIVFYLLTHFNVTILSTELFWLSIFLMILLLFLCIVVVFQYFKNKHNEEEQHTLLSLMKEYEMILDNDRMNRHEMVNNLVVLKSFKDKASVEFDETINDIIKKYQEKKTEIYSNLYNLPSGVKGIIYYNFPKIKENNINFNLFSSSDIEEYFEKLNSKLYFKVCKILGIFLNNAIEAASLTESKVLLIDIYKDDRLVIYMENSFVNNIDFKEINNKGVSSKGTNRGYGLYIVNKLINETDFIDFEQCIRDDKFVTILKIKNPSNYD